MTDSHDIDVLEGVLGKVEAVVAGVRPDQLDDPTPCSEFDVQDLENHVVGLMQAFAAAAQGTELDFDPTKVVSDNPEKDVRVAAEALIEGWRTHGTDRKVTVMGTGPGMPGEMVLGLSIMEYVAHGSDLAIATGQPIPFTDDEAAFALAKAQASLTDDSRGDSFGPRIEVPEDAPAIERYLGFMGRAVG